MSSFPSMRFFAYSLGLTLVLAAAESRAGVIMVLQASSPTPNGPGVFRYTYDASLSPDSQLQLGDYFAVIDFAGYIAGSVFSTNPDITATSQLTTLPPPFQAFPDDPTIPNLLFTYTGTVPLTGPRIDLGDFGADSTFGLTGLINQTASVHKEEVQGSNDFNLLAGNTTSIQGPAAISPVPEPTSAVLFGMGFVGLIGSMWTRQRLMLS